MPSIFSKPYPENAYQVTLLRHGMSVGNAEDIYQGQSDYPLNETGQAQVQALADRWLKEEVAFDLAITSPLARARGTAEIIAGKLNLPLEEDALWMERDGGKISGLRPEEAEERYPRPAFIDIYRPVGLTGESQFELFLRAGKAVQGLVSRPLGKYLVVSHGGILNMVLYSMLGITPQANFHGPVFRFPNAAFTRLTYLPDNNSWIMETINDRRHWP